jgi:hypothetical protein
MAVDRWPLIDGRWPKERWWLAKKALGGWPLLWPDTYLRGLNQTNEKNIAGQKSFVSIIFF